MIEKTYHLCISRSQVQMILNVSESTARTVYNDIKEVHIKGKNQTVTIKEFCKYIGLPFRDVFCMINNIKSDDYEAAILKSGIEVPKIEFLDHKK